MKFKNYCVMITIFLASRLLSACGASSSASANAVIETTPESLPNPASAYCQDHGGQLVIKTDASGGQFGVCNFPDGSACEEWAFYRDECSPTNPQESQSDELISEEEQDEVEPVISEQSEKPAQPVIAWIGHISSTPPGSQYDDYISLMPAGSGEIGLNGSTPEIEAQIEALRDRTGIAEFPALWGSLSCDVPDYGGCQLLVSEVRYGQYLVDPTPVEGWQGSVACSHFNSSPSNRCGNAFVLSGDFPVWYGLWSSDPEILAQIAKLRDSGQAIQVWGQLLAGVPDVNGNQIQVDRIEVVTH